MIRTRAEITKHITEIVELEDGSFWFRSVMVAADEDLGERASVSWISDKSILHILVFEEKKQIFEFSLLISLCKLYSHDIIKDLIGISHIKTRFKSV